MCDLDDLHPELVIVWDPLLVEDEPPGLLPVDLDVVDVLICQGQPHLDKHRQRLTPGLIISPVYYIIVTRRN